ncbi:MAG: hypothetical protein KatS3mg048_2275 [Caldilinea sp.]|jgi:hypothetical protein|nr:MAG: hypothetical protein KatS3mg048_2275 [Caldilinea sp.]
MVPEIQLMLRAERDAAMQRRPAFKDCGDFAAYELIRFSAPAKQIRQFADRFNVHHQPVKMHPQGALQCKCAC